MDKKILAVIAVVVIVVVAAAATYVVLSDDDEDNDNVSVIGRVNSVGSELYINADLLDNKDDVKANTFEQIENGTATVPVRNGAPFYTVETAADGTISYTLSDANKAAWGGLNFGTPGAATIQHVQIALIANALGLKFSLYQEGQSKNVDTIYYTVGIANASLATSSKVIDAGTLWEPQPRKIIDESESYVSLALTNYLFPDHTCCVIVGADEYLQSHPENAERFLAGYVQGVNFVNNAMKDTTSEDYKWLVDFASKKTSGLNPAEIEESLATIDYLSADSADGSLSTLAADVGSLITSLKSLANSPITANVDDANALGKALVDDSYMKAAVSNSDSLKGSNNGSITVAVIAGDIHQIAVHVAIEKGYFAQYGLDVKTAQATNGPGVFTSIINDEADVGFIGAPPTVINAVNGDYIDTEE